MYFCFPILMKMQKKNFLLVLISFIAVLSLQAQQHNNDKLIWAKSFENAMKIAKEKNLAVLLFFKGSDSCSTCIKMQENIINTPDFIDYAQNTFVMLAVDFPPSASIHLTAEKMKENRMLQTKYNPSAKIPQLVVIDRDASIKATANYVDIPVAEYLPQFRALLNMFK
jgi:thioredoxin-related protein